MEYVVRKGWICAEETARASAWGKGGTGPPCSSCLQLQEVSCNTERTNLGPIYDFPKLILPYCAMALNFSNYSHTCLAV